MTILTAQRGSQNIANSDGVLEMDPFSYAARDASEWTLKQSQHIRKQVQSAPWSYLLTQQVSTVINCCADEQCLLIWEIITQLARLK